MKKHSLKKIQLLVSSFFIFLVHLLFVFAKNKPVTAAANKHAFVAPTESGNGAIINPKSANGLSMMYDSLKLNIMGLSQQAFQCAMHGFDYLIKAGKVSNQKIISIADFSLPSYKKRLFVIDLDKYKVVFNTYVAHGVNSGKEYATDFSNSPESNKTSLGFYETMDTYNGKNGYSLHLQGLEKGINDNADSRAIVMHGAEYVSEDYINAQGYIGRSWGCPAIPEKLHKPIIDKIKNGSCLFIYSPNKNYLIHSRILKEAQAMVANSRS
ncbi:MAG: murein L,D-transpeptidase catalytic domain family protein [Ferruginibacter sp.]